MQINDIDLEFSTYPVPSEGRFYDGLTPNGEVSIREMSFREHMLLSSGTAADTLRKIVTHCIKLPPGLPAQRLLLTDRVAIFIAIRIKTFGPNFDVETNCPHCAAQDVTTVIKKRLDLTKELASESPGVDVEPFPVLLRKSKRTAYIRFLRGDDEAPMAALAAGYRKSKSYEGEDVNALAQLMLQVVSVDSVNWSTDADKEEWLLKLSSSDYVDLQDALRAVESGINLRINVTCDKCKGEVGLILPFADSSFFRRPADTAPIVVPDKGCDPQ